MPVKGRIKRVDPIPGDPEHKLLTWEDLYYFYEQTEPIPADWNMGQIKRYVRSMLHKLGPVTGQEVEE